MRLLWLIDSLTLGGAETLAAKFAIEARRRGLDVTLAVLKTIGGNPIEKRLHDADVAIVHLGSKNLRDVRAFRRLISLIRDERYELVHSHLTYASIWGAVASARTGVPHVATLHTLPLKPGAGAADRVRQRLLVSLLTRYAARVIAVSDAQRSAWIQATPLRSDKVIVVPNGVATAGDEPSSAAREEGMTSTSDSPAIGTIAALRRGKGFDILLPAFRRVQQEMPHATLRVAGDGALRDALQRQATDLGIAASTEWLGYREDVDAVLARLDVFVHPTFEDALPTAVLEAMAAGVPVVASAIGGVPEIITHEVDGLLVAPGDVDALAAAILRLLRDAGLRTRLAEAGRATIGRRFAVDVWIESLLGVYRDVIEEAA